MTARQTFDDWLAACNTWLEKTVGVGSLEITDWHWRDAFEDGTSPEEAAREAFAADDLGSLFLDLLDGDPKAHQTF